MSFAKLGKLKDLADKKIGPKPQISPLRFTRDYYQMIPHPPRVTLTRCGVDIKQSPFVSDRAKRLLCGDKEERRHGTWKVILIFIAVVFFIFTMTVISQRADQQVQVNEHFSPSSYSTEGGW